MINMDNIEISHYICNDFIFDLSSKLEFSDLNAKCKMQNAECRNCVAIMTPPSDEGGVIFTRK